MSLSRTAIPRGSWVLVTGATGYIASYIISRLLQLGYKVRGTVRDVDRAAWLKDELFSAYVSLGYFETFHVPDLGADNAFDEALKGMSGVIHVATVVSLSPDPKQVIPQTVAGVLNILNSATKEPSVKRVVYTSSAITSAMPLPNTEFHVDSNSWNDIAGQIAWAPPPYEPSRGMPVYMASKVEAEKAVLKFFTDHQPKFAVNVVNPFTTLGPVLNKIQRDSTTPSWIMQLWNGEIDYIKDFPCLNYIHVSDVAWIHAAALLDPELNGQRLPVWNEGFNWNDILAIFRKLHPERQFIDDLPGMAAFLGTVDDRQSLSLLKKWAGREKYISLDQCMKEMVQDFKKS